MTEILLVYLWSIWGGLTFVVTTIALCSVLTFTLIGFISYMSYTIDKSEVALEALQNLKKYKYYLIVPVVISILLPNKNELILIAAAPTVVKSVYQVADSNATKQLAETPAKLVKTLNLSIDYLNKHLGESK